MSSDTVEKLVLSSSGRFLLWRVFLPFSESWILFCRGGEGGERAAVLGSVEAGTQCRRLGTAPV